MLEGKAAAGVLPTASLLAESGPSSRFSSGLASPDPARLPPRRGVSSELSSEPWFSWPWASVSLRMGLPVSLCAGGAQSRPSPRVSPPPAPTPACSAPGQRWPHGALSGVGAGGVDVDCGGSLTLKASPRHWATLLPDLLPDWASSTWSQWTSCGRPSLCWTWWICSGGPRPR